MPKPVLSDSLFNADDVATAVLSEANLQISNENLGKTVLTLNTHYQVESGWTLNYSQLTAFNGLMFVSILCHHSSTVDPNQGENFFTITNSDYYPVAIHSFPSISYQGDSLWMVKANTNGQFEIHDVNNLGSTNFWVCINGWYRYS